MCRIEGEGISLDAELLTQTEEKAALQMSVNPERVMRYWVTGEVQAITDLWMRFRWAEPSQQWQKADWALKVRGTTGASLRSGKGWTTAPGKPHHMCSSQAPSMHVTTSDVSAFRYHTCCRFSTCFQFPYILYSCPSKPAID